MKPPYSDKKIDRIVLSYLELMDDEYVQKEFDKPPLTKAEKIELLCSLLRELPKMVKWNGDRKYNKATIEAVRAEYDYQKNRSGKTDGRVKYTDAMKDEAHLFYKLHKETANNLAAKTWVENHCIPHLARTFGKEKSYFDESTIRKNWLKLTS